jgi:hypothetical protein
VGFIESYIQDRALLWDKGVRADLNTLIPHDSGYHLIVAFDVNARGEIVVCAVQQSTGHIHAALLTPKQSDMKGDTGEFFHNASADHPSVSPRAQHMLDHARRMKSGQRPGPSN